jgi:hypothetical protein
MTTQLPDLGSYHLVKLEEMLSRISVLNAHRTRRGA